MHERNTAARESYIHAGLRGEEKEKRERERESVCVCERDWSYRRQSNRSETEPDARE